MVDHGQRLFDGGTARIAVFERQTEAGLNEACEKLQASRTMPKVTTACGIQSGVSLEIAV